MTIEAFRAVFLPTLRAQLETNVARLRPLTGDPEMDRWLDHVVELSQGGKCLRPYLSHAFYRACGGGDPQAYVPVSAFLEIFHLFALVHDDIIDEGVTRHGLPTQHLFVRAALQGRSGSAKPEHIADGQAMLIGDLLLFWSADIVVGADLRGMDRRAVWAGYREMLETVVIGEMMDVDLCTRPSTDMERIRRKSMLKSGHYSMLHPLVLGAAFAGSPEGMALARAAGEHLGLAFQIQDDLLDITGDAKHVGKATMNDLAEGQHTFFTQYVADHGSDEQRATLARFRGRRLTDGEAAQARQVFADAGAIAAGQQAIEQGYDQGRAMLAGAPFLQPEARDELTAFIDRLKERTK